MAGGQVRPGQADRAQRDPGACSVLPGGAFVKLVLISIQWQWQSDGIRGEAQALCCQAILIPMLHSWHEAPACHAYIHLPGKPRLHATLRSAVLQWFHLSEASVMLDLNFYTR